jgi:hypothetical protein
MKGWIRIGIVLSAFWLVGVLLFAVADFLSIPSSSCLFLYDPSEPSQAGEKYLNISSSIKTSFFSCNVYSQFISNSWERYFISLNHQIIEFNTKHFISLLLIPVVALWLVAIAFVKSLRWVKNGFNS